jgi:hypothetical protein
VPESLPKISQLIVGLPVISATGAAIGIVCVSNEPSSDRSMNHGPNPSLTRNLPGWFLQRQRDVRVLRAAHGATRRGSGN